MKASLTPALAAAALSASLVAAAPGPLDTGSVKVPHHVLAGEFTVVGDGHTIIDLTVPEDVVFSRIPIDNPTFDFSTSADFAAVAIVEDADVNAQVVLAGEANPGLFCPPGFSQCEAITSETRVRNRISDRTADGQNLLVAGEYRLHLVTSGGEAEVTLRFPELPGAIEVEGAPADGVSVRVPDNDTLVTSPGTYTASTESTYAGKGLLWTWHGLSGNLGLIGRYGVCLWVGGLPESDLHRVPGCPTSSSEFGSERVEVSSESEVFMDVSVTGLDPGAYGVTGYFAGAGNIIEAGTLTMFLE
jgi:hypothetical protein